MGATPETIGRRTAEVLGVDPGALDAKDDLLLPPAGAEVLRRFNERLRERTGELYDDPELREAVVDSYFVDPAFGSVRSGARQRSRESRRGSRPRGRWREDWTSSATCDELAGSPRAVDPDDRDVLASGLRHWVRQLEVVERRLDHALELRRLRLAGGNGG